LRVREEAIFNQISEVGGRWRRSVVFLIDEFAIRGNARFMDASSQFRVQSVIAERVSQGFAANSNADHGRRE
jgi:hypothetical protein